MKRLECIDKLVNDWLSAGVQPGDTLLLHSSLRRTLFRMHTMGYELSANEIFESLREVLGSSGTLLLPTFNFDFTKGVPFDVKKTPSQMGRLTEIGRTFPGAVRTGHPIYSFAVVGAKASKFEEVINRSGYGEDSPFQILRDLDGTIAVLDLLDQNSMTFYHHVEEIEKVSYRFHKEFTAEYTDIKGSTSSRSFSLFVRDLERGVETYVNPMGERLWELGYYKGYRPWQGVGLRTIKARDIFQATQAVIRKNEAEGMLFMYSKTK